MIYISTIPPPPSRWQSPRNPGSATECDLHNGKSLFVPLAKLGFPTNYEFRIKSIDISPWHICDRSCAGHVFRQGAATGLRVRVIPGEAGWHAHRVRDDGSSRSQDRAGQVPRRLRPPRHIPCRYRTNVHLTSCIERRTSISPLLWETNVHLTSCIERRTSISPLVLIHLLLWRYY